MLKIKIYDCSDEQDLQDELNGLSEYLEKNNQEIIDIKFSASCARKPYESDIYCFSALVMYDDKVSEKYKPKKYEIVEKVSD